MRSSFRSTSRLICLVMALVITVAWPAGPAAADERSDEVEFYSLVNDLRASVGVQPLAVHPELVTESRLWVDELVRAGSLRHANDLSIGVTETWALLGENVGFSDQTVQVLFDAFVASPTHYDNLVEPTFDHIGVAVVHAPDGRIFTVHRFMDIAEAAATTTATADSGDVDGAPMSSDFAETQDQLDRAGI